MIIFFKQKISLILAFIVVLVFGYFSIYLMNSVFEGYAQDELQAKISQLESELAQAQLENQNK